MPNKPFFSVVIPAYNRERFISNAIQSVLHQSFTDFELLLVDDGSTDDTAEIVSDLAAKDNRVKYLHQENSGRCIARNLGIEAAQAEWVCFLDSDDEYMKNHLEVMHSLIQKYPEYKVFATEQIEDGKLRHYEKEEYKQDGYVFNFEDFIYSNPLQINQFCFNKKDVPYRFENERIPISEDWLFMRALTLEFPIYKSSEVTNNLIEHEQRSMNATDIRKIVQWNEYAGIKLVDKYLKGKKYKNLLSAHTYLLCANILLSSGLKSEAWPIFKKALKFSRSYTHPLFIKGLVKFVVK